ncbi:hypothetical protein [Aquimarina sp. RZ0]|uniref:hypothetical protein n=1 Tax=Aquimarina sp. RZ0 TaxID=2607730 RepID=UPI0011F34D50|nr:hypothetical protein [Aquimarina sp. RZ0]KAA1243103.1 hypothetical protein F0000_22645 [Aquimarina sp. RZ0]
MDTENFQNFIDGIIQPDLLVTLETYDSCEDDRKYQFILAELCNQVKTFALRQKFTPFIQLKDNKGNFIFNDRLTIKVETDGVKDFYDSFNEHHTDLIYNDSDKYSACYLVSYMTAKGPLTSIGKIILEHKLSELNSIEIISLLHKPIKDSVNYLVENGEVFPDEFNINPKPLCHHYDDKKKKWTIHSPSDTLNFTSNEDFS